MKRMFYEAVTVQVLSFQDEDVVTGSVMTERGVRWDGENWTNDLTDVFQ